MLSPSIKGSVRYLPWVLIALTILARLMNFWGLHYGNTDDISTDYMRMIMPFRTMISIFAASQSRIQWYLTVSFWAGAMRLANTPWYDVVNLSTFAASLLLPAIALRRYYFSPDVLLLYAVALFATLPLLFSYAPPYSNPLYMEVPVSAGSLAVILFERSQSEKPASGGIWWLLAGSVATALGICAYEAATMLTLMILGAYFVGSRAGRPWRTILYRRDFHCVAIVLACYSALYFAYRAVHPPAYGGVQASTSYLTPSAAAEVIGTLSSTSSIYAWFVRPQWAFYIDHDSDPIPIRAAIPPHNLTAADTVLALLTAGLTFYCIVSLDKKASVSVFRLVILALVFLAAPNLAYPLTAKIAALVIKKQLFAYGGTPYSQIGFAFAVAAIGLAVSRLPIAYVRVGAAAAVAVVIGLGSLAASGFNRESGLFARQQAAKWKVVRQLAACSAEIPQSYLQNLTAPRMWKAATAGLSWGDPGQEELYWDVFAFKRYGVHMHFAPASKQSPTEQLDFHLAKDGSLESVIVARSKGGRTFQEIWVIPAESGSHLSIRKAESRSILPCRDHIEALHLTGSDLQVEALPPLPPPPSLTSVQPEVELPVLAPRFGVGQDQVFHLSLTPLDQGEVVKTVGLMFNGMQSGVDACYVFWDVLKQERRLVNDNGEDSKVIRGASIGNQQCDFLLDGTNYNSDGKTIDLTYHVSFHKDFTGLKQIYLFRKNVKGGNTGLKRMGWWWVE